jgi:pilus assembly protein Flp/PilA
MPPAGWIGGGKVEESPRSREAGVESPARADTGARLPLAERGGGCVFFETCKGQRAMSEQLRMIWAEEAGQDLAEYALLILLIALIVIAAIRFLGQAVSNVYSNLGTNLSGQVS